jgi:hypothetical protein
MSLTNKSTWFHGSPLRLEKLCKGSSITQLEKLARAFSTKPTIVSVSDDGSIRHNGMKQGYIYKIIDMVTPDDIYKHPKTTMHEGWEWITKRDFRLEFLYEYESTPEDNLSEDEIRTLRDH